MTELVYILWCIRGTPQVKSTVRMGFAGGQRGECVALACVWCLRVPVCWGLGKVPAPRSLAALQRLRPPSPSSALPRPCHRPRLFSHGSDGASAFGRRPCGGSGGRHSSGASRRGRRTRPRGCCRSSRSSSAPGAAGSHHPGSRAEEGADARAERPRGGSQEGAAGPPACCEEDADPPHRRDRPVPARAGRRRLVGAAGVGPAGASGFRQSPTRTKVPRRPSPRRPKLGGGREGATRGGFLEWRRLRPTGVGARAAFPSPSPASCQRLRFNE
jgi:hypothetical protein